MAKKKAVVEEVEEIFVEEVLDDEVLEEPKNDVCQNCDNSGRDCSVCGGYRRFFFPIFAYGSEIIV